MAAPVFDPPRCPTIGSSQDIEAKVRSAKFGDGYEQTAPDGINSIRSTFVVDWPMLTREEALVIEVFFKARRGSEPFIYRPPGEDEDMLWKCSRWRKTSMGRGRASINATFVQAFDVVGP